MARRATLFSKYGEDSTTLRIAGPYEFTKWNTSQTVNTDSNSPLIKGYEQLSYSLGVLAPNESYTQSSFAKNRDEDWVQVSTRPQVHRIPTDNGLVAVVIFPTITDKGTPSPEIIKDILTITDTMHKDPLVKMIIGISPWGKQQEQHFLDHHSGSCDVLLGSGPGPGLTASFSADRRTLWTRAYSKGRTVTMIQIDHFPSRAPSSSWTNGQTIKTKLLVLNEKIQDNPAMQTTLAPLNFTVSKKTSNGK